MSDINRQVAEIIGWTGDGGDGPFPQYDSDLNLAWDAAEKFLATHYPGWRINITKVSRDGCHVTFDSFAQSTGAIEGTGDTPALALCDAIIAGGK